MGLAFSITFFKLEKYHINMMKSVDLSDLILAFKQIHSEVISVSFHVLSASKLQTEPDFKQIPTLRILRACIPVGSRWTHGTVGPESTHTDSTVTWVCSPLWMTMMKAS